MVKYRRLSDEELKELEPELKQFLITNAIYDEEWVKINKNDPEKALSLVDKFSDLVLEKSLEEIKYLVHSSSDSLKLFWYRKNTATLIGLDCSSSTIDFNSKEWMLDVPECIDEIKWYKQEKKVSVASRSKEIYQLINAGAEVASEQFFKLVHDLVEAKK